MGSHTLTARHGQLLAAAGDDSFFAKHGYMRVPAVVQWMATLRCDLSCPQRLPALLGRPRHLVKLFGKINNDVW